MSKLFYLSEIIKFAIEKEQESFNLYEKMATQVTDSELQKIFQRLAQEEVKHKDFYTTMLSTVKIEQSPGVKENDEYQSYVEALITDSRTVPTITATDFKNTNKVLDYAIAREKDSILFYSGLKNFVAATAHGSIDTIIREEERHAAILMKVKANFK